ncbi:MAG: O-antigen ligase family protein [Clostridiales bacterium]|nr:O-antigen ligase family protein [Clostridiales bacterium]
MNSFIISSLAGLFRNIGNKFKESATSALFTRIYLAFSRAWENSLIMGLVGSQKRGDKASKSLIYKIFRLPITFWEYLRGKIGIRLGEKIKTSLLCGLGRDYIQSFMAVNTRFWGVMLLSASAAYTALKLAAVHSYSKPVLAAGAVGVIMLLLNYNLTAFLNGSGVVTFIKKAAGFENLDFEFYDEKRISGVQRLVLAAIIGICTGAAVCFSPLLGLMLPFAVFGGLLVMWVPVTGVFAAMFIAPFAPTMALAGVCMLTTLSLLVKALTKENFKWRFGGVGLGLVLLLTLLFVSCVFSFARVGSLTVWAMYFVFIVFYLVIVNTLETKEQIYALIKLFVIAGALVALYGVMQYAFGWTTTNAWIDETMFEDDTMRVYSTMGNPNVLGEFLLVVMPFAAVYFLKYKAKTWAKWVYLAMFALMGLCLVLTQSRGCWIGFMVSLAVFVTFYEGRLWGLLPIAVCIIPFVIPETMVERFMSIGNMEDSSTSYRVYIWLATINMLKHYWVGGIGMGELAFNKVYPFFAYNGVVAPHSHNTFLQLTVEGGIGALVLFVVVEAVFVKKMSSLYRMDNKKSEDSMLALAAASGVLGFLVQSMFDYTFYNYRMMAMFFMVMAVGVSLLYIKSEEAKK